MPPQNERLPFAQFLLYLFEGKRLLGVTSPRTMTIQEQLLQGLGDKETARLQSLENLGKIAHEAHPVGPFNDAERSRERDIPAESYSPSKFVHRSEARLPGPLPPVEWLAVLPDAT
jgi:hypothetical protein